MQDVTNRPATVDVTSSPSKAREVLTLGAAAAATKRELGFAELGMRDTVFAAWQEIDWTETEARRAMSLKEQIAELCSELSIWTGWEAAAIPPQKLVFDSEQGVVRDAPTQNSPEAAADTSLSVAPTPEKVVKARASRRAMFMEEMKTEAGGAEQGGQVSAEKFICEDPLCRPLVQSDLGVAEQQPHEMENIEDDEDDDDVVEQPQSRKCSRSEAKSRKAMRKLGLVEVLGVARLTVKKSNGAPTNTQPDA